MLCTQLRKTIHTVVGTHSTRVRAGAAGNVVSRDVINGLLCVALLCRMFSQCFTLLAAAAAPISSKQAVRGAPIIAHPTCDDHCVASGVDAVRHSCCFSAFGRFCLFIEQAKIASLDDAGFYDPFHAERARQGADKMNNISKLLSFAPRAYCLRVVLCVVRKGGAKSSSVRPR